MSTTPAPAPLATTIAPAVPTPQAIVTTGAAPAAAPVYVIPAHEADDETLTIARAMGLGADLGLPTEAAPATAAPAVPPVATAAPPAEAAPVAPAPPAAETEAQRIARLESELKALKDAAGKAPPAEGPVAPPVPVVPATPANPLANLRNAEHIAQAEKTASDLQAWAIQNRDGGELPLALAQQVENAEALRLGRAPVQLTEAIVLPKEAAAQIESAAGQMLSQHVPRRREFLASQARAIEDLRTNAPDFLDVKKEQGQVFQHFASAYPHLLTVPEWPLILRDLATGYLANKPKPAASTPTPPAAPVPPPAPVPTVTDTRNNIIPMAPAAPLGGLAPSGPPVSQQRLEEALTRLNRGEHTDEDLTLLSANAI